MPPRRIAFEITSTSILKILIAAAAVWAWFYAWQFALALLVSIFLAVGFEPFAAWLETNRIPRWLASLLPVLILVAVVVGFGFVATSSISEQTKLLGTELSNAEQKLRQSFPILRSVFDQIHAQNNSASLSRYAAEILASTSRALLLIAIGLILTVYLLIERELTLAWGMAFVPKHHRPKMMETLSAVRVVVYAFLIGNLVTSIFATLFVFAALTALKVPGALVLALLAGICDFIPLLGFVVAGVPAVLLAATVSRTVALITAGSYIFYHFAENYLIAPRVYGDRMRLSKVAVIVAFALGGEFAGVIGALLALPLAATYAVVESIWMGKHHQPASTMRLDHKPHAEDTREMSSGSR